MKTKVLKSFEIDLARLENGTHHFQFELVPDFFETFENNLVEEGYGKASLVIDKSESMMALNFIIEVDVLLICDVSIESYRESLNCQKKHIVKFGLTNEELSDEISTIDMVEKLKQCSYIIIKEHDDRYSGGITTALSLNIPLIMKKSIADIYGIPAITYNNNINELTTFINKLSFDDYMKIKNKLRDFTDEKIKKNKKVLNNYILHI